MHCKSQGWWSNRKNCVWGVLLIFKMWRVVDVFWTVAWVFQGKRAQVWSFVAVVQGLWHVLRVV